MMYNLLTVTFQFYLEHFKLTKLLYILVKFWATKWQIGPYKSMNYYYISAFLMASKTLGTFLCFLWALNTYFLSNGHNLKQTDNLYISWWMIFYIVFWHSVHSTKKDHPSMGFFFICLLSFKSLKTNLLLTRNKCTAQAKINIKEQILLNVHYKIIRTVSMMGL
jgi:hypothetical protein